MSDLIRRAREALVNVTPGPWVMETVRTSCGTCHRIGPFPRPAYASNKPEGWACVYDDYPPGVGSPDLLANSRFIAAARDLVPAMAARLEAQEALLREAMAVLERCPPTSNPTLSAEYHLERINAWWRLDVRPALAKIKGADHD